MNATRFFGTCIFALLFAFTGQLHGAEDLRQQVGLPPPMAAHMLSNMRDHLAAIEAITRLLSEGEYGEAADAAESRLGMSSMQRHGGHRMGPLMPPAMRSIGAAMHRSASRFSIAARDAEVDGDLAAAFGGLSLVIQQCVACHEAFRLP